MGADASVRKSVCLSVWRRSVRAIVGPPNLDDSRARTYCACSKCGSGCLDIFSIVCNFSFLSPSLSFFPCIGQYGDIFPAGFDL